MDLTSCLWRGWVPNAGPEPPLVVSGTGIEVIDSTGKRYLDAQAAYSGASCGYGVSAIIEAVTCQARLLGHYPLEHAYNLPALTLAGRIADVMPDDLRHVFFCPSGSDAVEAALKMARMVQRLRGFSNRTVILTLPHAYHGATFAALSASDIGPAREGFGPFADGMLRLPAVSSAAVAQAIGELGAERIAAVLLEPIRGVGGVLLPGPDDLAGIQALCRRHGILLIADEIMTGFGRTGRWFAFEHWKLLPDIVTVEKGLTGGYSPLAAVVARRNVFETFAEDPILHGFRHGHTFCGHPIACAAGVAAIDEIRRCSLVENSAVVGAAMLDLAQRLRRHELVVDVRGMGLLIGIELGDEAIAESVRLLARERGLMARPQRKVLTLAPPLSTTAVQAGQIIDIVDASCAAAR